jgi:hypothetical protein
MDVAHTQPWGDTMGTTVGGTGDGLTQNLTIGGEGGAEEIARRILARLATQEGSLEDARFSVSIGIAVQGRPGATSQAVSAYCVEIMSAIGTTRTKPMTLCDVSY